MHEELVDRFGEMPEPARALLECHALRILAKPLGVSRLDATHESVVLQFGKDTIVVRVEQPKSGEVCKAKLTI